MQGQITVVLLLGSYDPQTKAYLETIKEGITRSFSGEGLCTFVLDNLEIYSADSFQILEEQTSDKKVTLFIFERWGVPSDVYDVETENSLDESVYFFYER